MHNRRQAQRSLRNEASLRLSRGALAFRYARTVRRARGRARHVVPMLRYAPLHLHGVMKIQALRASTVNGQRPTVNGAVDTWGRTAVRPYSWRQQP
ncbi:MAG: hypothetical protein LBU42_00970 [Prevotellaceae bacterium]|nr:hypothetical protein [Prevotellaceae bacterium]